MKVRLVCGNCAKVVIFDSWDDAFKAGWDTVAEFGYNACEKCPGVSVYFPMLYAQRARQTTNSGERKKLLEKAAESTMAFIPNNG
jgi:hypothetical protein